MRGNFTVRIFHSGREPATKTMPLVARFSGCIAGRIALDISNYFREATVHRIHRRSFTHPLDHIRKTGLLKCRPVHTSNIALPFPSRDVTFSDYPPLQQHSRALS